MCGVCVAHRNTGRAARALGVAVAVPRPYSETNQVRNKRIPEINVVQNKRLVRETLGDHYCYVDEHVKFAARSYYQNRIMSLQ